MNHRFCVAPMMDITDRHERYFLRELTNEAHLYTEMINVNAILYGNTKKLLKFNQCEHPLAIQLGGSDPSKLGEAALIAESFGYDEINLNIGCPSSKVQKGQFGAVLMKRPSLVSSCIKACIDKVNIPITIKCRIGVDEMDIEQDLDYFIKEIQDSGCKTVIVHARKALLKGLSPKDNRNIPPLDYERVYRLKEKFFNLEIILNGGIKSIEESLKHLQYVDGVMVGRMAYDNPYLLNEVDNKIYNQEKICRSKRDIMIKIIPYILKEVEAGEKIQLLTKHLMGFSKGCKFAKDIRSKLAKIYLSDKPNEVLYKIANQLS